MVAGSGGRVICCNSTNNLVRVGGVFSVEVCTLVIRFCLSMESGLGLVFGVVSHSSGLWHRNDSRVLALAAFKVLERVCERVERACELAFNTIGY